MTEYEKGRINYLIGRLEGISIGCDGNIQDAIIDTAELMNALVEKAEEKKEHDACVGCKYEDAPIDYEPCLICKHNCEDKWEANE